MKTLITALFTLFSFSFYAQSDQAQKDKENQLLLSIGNPMHHTLQSRIEKSDKPTYFYKYNPCTFFKTGPGTDKNGNRISIVNSATINGCYPVVYQEELPFGLEGEINYKKLFKALKKRSDFENFEGSTGNGETLTAKFLYTGIKPLGKNGVYVSIVIYSNKLNTLQVSSKPI